MVASLWWQRRIEEIAYRRLRQLTERGLWDGFPPVPIDHVIEHLLALTIVWETIAEEPDEEILACIRPGTSELVLNETHLELFKQNPGLERFSKAHEAGHADVFGLTAQRDQLTIFPESHYKPKRRSSTRGDVNVITRKLRELDGRTRAAVLRELNDETRRRQAEGEDPPLQRRSVDRYAATILMPEEQVRDRAHRGDLTSWPFVYELARGFAVSTTAMLVRLKELRLVFDVDGRRIVLQDPALLDQTSLF
jgi:hypothetical protein